jgi:hypothetical protein
MQWVGVANDCIRNDDGEITWIGNTYWHERYAIEDPAEMLLDGKSVIFQAA